MSTPEHTARPAQGWLFVEPGSPNDGVIESVGPLADVHRIGNYVLFSFDKPVPMDEVGLIAIPERAIIDESIS